MRLRALAVVGLCAGIAAPEARAADVEASVLAAGTAQSVPDGLFSSQLRLADAPRDRAERAALWLNGRAHVTARPVARLGLRAGLDTGLLEITDEGAFLDGRAPGAQAQRTLLLGETWIEGQLFEGGALLLRLGKFRANVGDHAVFDAYAMGLTADLDLSLVDGAPPWRVRARALFPAAAFERDTFESPLFDLEVGYRFGRYGALRALGAVYLDRGSIGPVLSDALVRGQAEAVLDGFARADPLLEANPCNPADDPPIRGPNVPERLACLRDAIVEGVDSGRFGYATDTRGHLGWTGLAGRLELSPVRLQAALLYGFGTVDATFTPDGGLAQAIRTGFARLKEALPQRAEQLDARLARIEENATRRERLSLSSWLAKLEAEVDVGDAVVLDAFFVALSGDDGLSARAEASDGRYGAFVSLAPQLPYTTLFFQGPALPVRSTPVAASVAPDGAGLVAGGLGAQIFLGARYRLRAGGAAMAALVAEDVSAFQGVEVDVRADAILTDHLLVAFDGAVFVPGPYFGDAPVGYQALLTARARWP